MEWFFNMKIGTKLLTGFVLIALIAGLIGLVGVINIHDIADKDRQMYEGNTISIATLGKISTQFEKARVNLAKILLESNRQKKEKYGEDIKESGDVITGLAAQLEKIVSTAEEKAFFKEFTDSRNVFRPIIAQIINLSMSGKDAEAVAIYKNEAVKAALAEQSAIDKLVEYNIKAAKLTSGQNTAKAHGAARFTMIFALAGMVLAVGLGFLISRSITGPLRSGVEFATAVAGGDLTHRLDLASRDETGKLASALNGMVENLRDIISKMAGASSSVSSAANQLSATSAQMAAGVEEVAAQAGNVAVASEEMTATSTEIASNCGMAAESSRFANDTALAGEVVVAETITVMGRIADRVRDSAKTVESLGTRSEQIGDIIGTIEEIADQTNLLALNAAIEAARAGEQGRGFAVVADEVRALAERTTKATKEISAMIKTIQTETQSAVTSMVEGVKEVEDGSNDAAKSGNALKEILEQINAVSMQINQIATAAEQQTATITEITDNIQQITNVVQETAKGAEESASAANQLAKMAEELQNLSEQFRLTA
jgi:methyl-accepting chemotaxis protein